MHDQVQSSMLRLVSGRLLGGTRVCLVVQGLECAMNSERRRQERLSRRRELL